MFVLLCTEYSHEAQEPLAFYFVQALQEDVFQDQSSDLLRMYHHASS